jgi:hypothetical protein
MSRLYCTYTCFVPFRETGICLQLVPNISSSQQTERDKPGLEVAIEKCLFSDMIRIFRESDSVSKSDKRSTNDANDNSLII